jgi:hypothetical protein
VPAAFGIGHRQHPQDLGAHAAIDKQPDAVIGAPAMTAAEMSRYNAICRKPVHVARHLAGSRPFARGSDR